MPKKSLLLCLCLAAGCSQVFGGAKPRVSTAGASAHAAQDVVVLLHGLGLNRVAMFRIARTLRREGYRVINVSYPSRSLPVEELGERWLPELLRSHDVVTAARVHFVTHSMGGIIVRVWLRDSALPNLGRIVMLAPPNHGSEVADRLRGFPPFRVFTGVNGKRLGKGADSVPLKLGPVSAKVGIIAGNRSLNPLFSAWIAGPDDGKVSVESARLEGMRDFKIMPHSHTWLQWRRDVVKEVSAFLRTGAFTR